MASKEAEATSTGGASTASLDAARGPEPVSLPATATLAGGLSSSSSSAAASAPPPPAGTARGGTTTRSADGSGGDAVLEVTDDLAALTTDTGPELPPWAARQPPRPPHIERRVEPGATSHARNAFGEVPGGAYYMDIGNVLDEDDSDTDHSDDDGGIGGGDDDVDADLAGAGDAVISGGVVAGDGADSGSGGAASTTAGAPASSPSMSLAAAPSVALQSWLDWDPAAIVERAKADSGADSVSDAGLPTWDDHLRLTPRSARAGVVAPSTSASVPASAVPGGGAIGGGAAPSRLDAMITEGYSVEQEDAHEPGHALPGAAASGGSVTGQATHDPARAARRVSAAAESAQVLAGAAVSSPGAGAGAGAGASAGSDAGGAGPAAAAGSSTTSTKPRDDAGSDSDGNGDDDTGAALPPPEFYDATEDDSNQQWVDSTIGELPEPLRALKTDAVLSCPYCFTIVTHHCQQHSEYSNQYRSVLVSNCKVRRGDVVRYPAPKKRRGRSRRQHGGARAAPEDGAGAGAGVTGDDGAPPAADPDEIYHPVECANCGTEVGLVEDTGDNAAAGDAGATDVYHLFNVVPT